MARLKKRLKKEKENWVDELLEYSGHTALLQHPVPKRTFSQSCIDPRYYHRRIKLCYFKDGHLVLYKVALNSQDPNAERMNPNWEDPYWCIQQSIIPVSQLGWDQ
ncbi:hypothetical protein HAX54_048000 [Datura stramonium]|uniref:Uncharacterized protein n=1 Tax=Datura stramonium TaxID=4076 RepID=A0ABS8SUN7_DATST|nr:hypothetical protein [Datura stramonium]